MAEQVQGVPAGLTEEPAVEGVPAGLTAEALPKPQVEGVPEGLTEESLAPHKATPAPKAVVAPKPSPKANTATASTGDSPLLGIAKQAVANKVNDVSNSLTKADESGKLPLVESAAVKTARGVLGLYNGLAGNEESEAAKGKTTTASPAAANLGFTPENIGYNVGKMGRGIYEFGKDVISDLAGKTPVAVPDEKNVSVTDPKAHTMLAKYVTAPSQAERDASEKEMEEYFKSQGPAAAGHAISAFLHGTLGEYVPGIGPVAMALTDQAQKGDLGGALSQIAALYGFEKGTGALKNGIKDRVNAKVAELTKTPEVAQAEQNVETLGKEKDAAKKKLDAALAKHQQYTASHQQGIGSPEKVVNEVKKAQEAYDEAEAHHELAKEDLKNKQKTIPQRVGGAVGKVVGKVLPTPEPAPTPEVPTEEVEAKPVLTKLGVPEEPAKPLPPINVKTPGQVQPELFPQPLREKPQPSYGRLALPNDQGTVGTPRLLTEGTPEGPQVPKGGLPKINLPEEKTTPAPEPKPTTDEAALRALSAKKGEVVETTEKKVHRLLQEALKNDTGTNKNFPAAKVEEEPVEQRKEERRVSEEPHEGTERRQTERRVLKSMNEKDFQEGAFGGGEKPIDTDAYAAATEQARKELGPDATKKAVIARRNELVGKPEPKGDIGEQSRRANPEPTRAETKAAALPKEEPLGYSAKKEDVVPAGQEGREPVKSAEEYHPQVVQKINELSDENLKKLAQAHGLNPDEYDFKARDERRHRVERDQLANDIAAQLGEDEKINLGRAAEATEKQGTFKGADVSAKGRADRAAKMFPRLRGPVDEYGNPIISGGAPDTAAEKLKERVAKTSTKDTDHVQNAMKELGPNAKLSDIMRRAQDMKDEAAKPVDLKKTVNEYNKKEGLGEVKDNNMEVDPRGKEIARAYDDMKHDPNNPEVKKSYAALIDDAKKQWDMLEKADIKLEPQDADPYTSYEDMKKDFEDNKRLKVWRGGNPFPEGHPMAKVDPKTGETYNVMFRAVHDTIGHLMHDNDFSEKGEQNAFDTHRQTLSREAIPAMTTETKGQVAHFFNKEGGPNGVFPDQKAGILPERFIEDAPDPKEVIDHIKSGKDYALLTAENPNNERATSEENAKRNREMKADLESMGYKPIPIEGHNADVQGEKENSFFVPDITPEDASKISRKYEQSSVMTKQGIHDLVKDTVHPSTGLTEGQEAAKQPYHSTVAGKPFSLGVDFDKSLSPKDSYGNPTVSGGSQSSAKTKKLPTGDQLIKKYGEAPDDPAHIAFLLKDGRGVNQTGTLHDVMLGGKPTDDLRERFINEQGGIRMRASGAYGDRRFAISVPEKGISQAQYDKLMKMAPQMSTGRVYIEKANPTEGGYRIVDSPSKDFADKFSKALREVAPVLNDKGAPVDEFGNPTVSGGSQSAGTGAAKEKPPVEGLKESLPELAQKHLSEEEKSSVTTTATGKPRTAGTEKFISNMEKLPTVQEYTDIALQGEGARKWYSRSSAAFEAMHDAAPDYFKEGDKQKFMGVLAGSSPQQSVAMNLRETLGFWKEWVDAGRPEFSLDKWQEFGEEADKAWKEDGSPRAGGRPKGASMHWDYAPTGAKWKAENLLLKNLTLPETKVPNIIKALNGEDMWPDLTKNQAFKAPSFAKNLRKWLDGKSTGTKYVTNDSWMGLFGGIDKSALSRPENYHPLSVATRAAAQELGWEPEEAQAAIWSFTQALTEKGVEDPELIRHYSEDFKDLMENDLETRDLLKDLGVNLDELDGKLSTIEKKPKVSGRSTPTTAHSIRQLKERIETARGKGAIPEPKSVQGNLFRENPVYEHKVNPGAGYHKDEAVRFEPSELENENSHLEKLGKKKSPYRRIGE